jgi:hypothetical protein
MNTLLPRQGIFADWTSAHRRYLLIETLVGIAITIVLSCLFAALIFAHSMPLASDDLGLQVDSAIQALIVGFMSSMVPTVLTTRRRRVGIIANISSPHAWPKTPWRRSVAIAALVGIPAALLHATVMTRVHFTFPTLSDLLLFKCGFGTLVALVACPTAIALALRDPQ